MPPAERSLIWVRRDTGQTLAFNGGGEGTEAVPADRHATFDPEGTVKVALGIFDATPGIQTPVDAPGGDRRRGPLAADARVPERVYAGLSIANGPVSLAPAIRCDATCLAQLASATTTQPIPLSPKVTTTTKIGIFVARVTGKRKLLGRRAPRLRVLGKVPLDTAKKARRNRFRWNGKRLKRGTYRLTYRSLKGKRVTNTSGSIRFKVAKGGKVRQVRSEPLRTPKR